MRTGNPALWLVMDASPDGFSQTVHVKDGASETTRSERIDLVIGSGKMGQTYCYRQGSELYELPVPFVRAADRWVNSPGQRCIDGAADFDRPIGPRRLDCHATWVGAAPCPSNSFSRDALVLGVSCEGRHGPGADHVEWRRAHPDDRVGRKIGRPSELSRERSLDLCGQCHGGGTEFLKSAFSCGPGDVLDDYVKLPPPAVAPPPGIHTANQVNRLRQSRCFLESDSLTCARCHDPHAVARDDPARFSKRCMSCHQPQACGMFPRLGHGLEGDCVSCHMPTQDVRSMVFQSAGATSHPTMTDHRIAVDRQATERFLAGRGGRSK